MRMSKPEWVGNHFRHTNLVANTMSNDRFIQQVQRVCDYLVASGSAHASELENALNAYKNAENGVDHYAELRRVVSETFPTIEKRTLAAVLSGSFRLGEKTQAAEKKRLFSSTNLIAILGLLFIAASLHWTYWSTRASAVMGSLDSVLETQRNLNIEEIVHTRDFCQYQNVQLDDQDVYRFILAARDMAYYDKIWLDAQEEAHSLNLEFWPAQQMTRWVRGKFSSLFGDGELKLGEQIIGPNSAQSTEELCKFFAELSNRTLDAEFRWYQASFADLANTIPLASGSELFRGTGTASIVVLKKKLVEYQSIIHQWLLPTLHGALGAIIFCLVRAIREPFLVPLGTRDIMLRLFFGAFVGYLVSALFAPAGMLGQPATGTAPITSIAAFIFGYSIDSFITILNRMNRFIVELPEPKGSSKT